MIPERDNDLRLSELGAVRRDAMLAELLAEMNAMHRRRRQRRTAALIAAPVVAVSAAVIFWLANSAGTGPQRSGRGSELVADAPQRQPSIEPERQPGAAASEHEKTSMVGVEYVKTEIGIADRYRAVSAPNVERLDDAALLDTLARLNRPAGLIRSQGRVWLTADVTDQRGG